MDQVEPQQAVGYRGVPQLRGIHVNCSQSRDGKKYPSRRQPALRPSHLAGVNLCLWPTEWLASLRNGVILREANCQSKGLSRILLIRKIGGKQNFMARALKATPSPPALELLFPWLMSMTHGVLRQ
jgi:hypothetical protein